jgi:superfamily II DNA or RNA helicase
MAELREGDWAYSREHREVVRVVEATRLWGLVAYRVFLPSREAVVRVGGDGLVPVSDAADGGPARLSYAIAAARVADAMAQDVLLAPLEGNVEPLPHQILVLGRAVAETRVRYLLADEVGLGKTIEAGLIMRELKLRGLVRRTLVVAPKGLVTQWVAEMRTHFNEEFRLLVPGEFGAYRRFVGEENLWRRFDQVVCPMDSVKPLDGRRGWSKDQVEEYNRERFGDLIAGGWDLVIVDEAHRLGGSTDTVARFRLGEGLAEAAPYLLLLSATPHQGKTDAFHRILWLLDAQAFPDAGAVTRERVQHYVIRTEKRRAIDAEGNPLFKPRRTQLVPVAWVPRHDEQRRLYEAVTDYVREGYNQALREKRHYIGFLMILMQRLVTSSTRAIATTLEKRLAILGDDETANAMREPPPDTEWSELDGQEQLELLFETRLQALRNEHGEVAVLLELARRCMAGAPDAKAEALLDYMYRLQQEESDPTLKFLVFTEFVPTQEMLRDFLAARGFSVACLNGSMDMEQRRRVQQEFAGEARVLVSTDAGGEGLNLQFCHVVVNYDLPWNPMRIEQRIGRVDRIGQKKVVRALNLVLEDSVEHRVREVLETKLRTILEEFGVDKAGDVLDSAEAEQSFESVYVGAMLDPTQISQKVDTLLSLVRARAWAAREGAGLLTPTQEIDPHVARGLSEHPLPTWVERMTLAYLETAGGRAERDLFAWNITWPDGAVTPGVVFHQRQAEATGAQLLSLEDVRVRGLASSLPRAAQGQPVSVLRLPDLPSEVRGIWSLWRVALCADDERQVRVLPVFRHDDGRTLAPTARHLWDRLLGVERIEIVARLDGSEAEKAYEQSLGIAKKLGQDLFRELHQQHRRRLQRDREKTEFALTRRREAIRRIGLPAVRQHRLAELEREAAVLRMGLAKREGVAPELDAIVFVRVESGP